MQVVWSAETHVHVTHAGGKRGNHVSDVKRAKRSSRALKRKVVKRGSTGPSKQM